MSIRPRWGIRVRDVRNPRTALVHRQYLTWWGAYKHTRKLNWCERTLKDGVEFTYAPERLR